MPQYIYISVVLHFEGGGSDLPPSMNRCSFTSLQIYYLKTCWPGLKLLNYTLVFDITFNVHPLMLETYKVSISVLNQNLCTRKQFESAVCVQIDRYIDSVYSGTTADPNPFRGTHCRKSGNAKRLAMAKNISLRLNPLIAGAFVLVYWTVGILLYVQPFIFDQPKHDNCLQFNTE